MCHGDFTYNGIPIFDVGFLDFAQCKDFLDGCRLLSKNIYRDELREYYRGQRGNKFGVRYCGVILDMRTRNKNKIMEL